VITNTTVIIYIKIFITTDKVFNKSKSHKSKSLLTIIEQVVGVSIYPRIKKENASGSTFRNNILFIAFNFWVLTSSDF